MHSILIVDDEPDICELLEDILTDEGYEVQTALNGKEARDKFNANSFSIILMDIWMPDIDGISLLTEFIKSARKTPGIIMMSGHGTVETAVEATRLGAYDFLEKPLSTAKLLLVVQNAINDLAVANEPVKPGEKAAGSVIIGKSQATHNLRQKALNAANHAFPVLLLGETGTGKSLLARFIHANSANNVGPFVKLSTSTILSANMQRELFGAEIGSQIHKGKLEIASGGTLYIQQIENMEFSTQSALAGVLSSGEYKRLGGFADLKTDFRFIASSSADLAREMRVGNFSEQLYFLLNLVNINVPSLSERREDINDLIEFFSREITETESLPYRKFSLAAKNFMLQHDWFGNVLELENLVRRLLLNGDSQEITLEEVKENLAEYDKASAKVISDSKLYGVDLKSARDAFERGYLLHHLRKAGGNISQTAQNIGVERANLYRKLRVHKIDPKSL